MASTSGLPVSGAAARPWRSWLEYAALVGLCLLGYGRSLDHGFMLDDHVVLFGSRGVENSSLVELFTTRQFIFYRPVGHLVLLAAHRAFGTDPLGYHVVNLLLFCLAVGLLRRILVEVGATRRVAFLAAALYAVHPVHAFLVEYVTASVITTFLLTIEAAYLCHLLSLQKGRERLRWLSRAFLLAALMSHEMAVVFPVAVAVTHYWARRSPLRESVERALPSLLLTLTYLLLRQPAAHLGPPARGAVLAWLRPEAALSTLSELVGWYLGRMLAPRDIVFLWQVPVDARWGAASAIAVLGLGAAALILVSGRRGLRPFAVAFFLAGFLPLPVAAFTYATFTGAMLEPHWFYFSSIGFFLLAGSALDSLFRARQGRWLGPLASILVLSALLLTLQGELRHWRDEETYSRFWLRQNTENWTPFLGAGRGEASRGEYGRALTFLFEGHARIARFPSVVLLTEIGWTYYLAGMPDHAEEWLRLARRVPPSYAESSAVLGRVAAEKGDWVTAEAELRRAVELFPGRRDYARWLELVRAEQAIPRSEPRP